jgi:hypothetical protein
MKEIEHILKCKQFPGSITVLVATERVKFGDRVRNVLVGLVRRTLVARTTSPWNNWKFSGESPTISNLTWMMFD